MDGTQVFRLFFIVYLFVRKEKAVIRINFSVRHNNAETYLKLSNQRLVHTFKIVMFNFGTFLSRVHNNFNPLAAIEVYFTCRPQYTTK